MSSVIVTPVATRREKRQFINLPWRLYRDDPNWMPPLRMSVEELVGYRRHAFQQNAEIQTFLARRDGELCGRVAAILNHEHNRHHDERRGFFGFFESTNDVEVSAALFDATREWFAQRDVRKLRGPTNPSMNYECGLLIDGFDTPPTFMMTYNPPYYAELIESYGFRKTHDMYAYVGNINQLPELEHKLQPLIDQINERLDVKIRWMGRARFREDVELFFHLYNRAMLTTWGFTPLPDAEMMELGNSLRHLIIPELAFVADVDGQHAGTVLALPDVNPQIKQSGGRLLPFGWWRLLQGRRHPKRVRVLSINVAPEYQRWGLGLVLMAAMVPKALEIGVEEAEFSWISEANDLARMGLEKGGATIAKTYRLYDYGPAEDA